jgi:hypothetical protein
VLPTTPPTPPPGPPQDFPYYFEADVTHWLLWNTCPLDTPTIWQQVEQKFQQQQWEALMFVNPAALQSILSVRGAGGCCGVGRWWHMATCGGWGSTAADLSSTQHVTSCGRRCVAEAAEVLLVGRAL